MVVDYAARYPKAISLRAATALAVAQELATLFTRVGFPKQLVTDQSTVFMGKTLKALAQLVGMQALHTTVYHPQTNGLVERLNGTLKKMIRKFISEGNRDWHRWLPFLLLFAVREVAQSSMRFSPFELLYGRHPRGNLRKSQGRMGSWGKRTAH